MEIQSIIYEIKDYLKEKLDLKNGYFCIYGSYATDTQTDESDIDILYIDNSIKDAYRLSEKYKNIEISIYMISEKILLDDSNGKYGGFFCGKIFNPYITLDTNKKNDDFLNYCIANYFKRLFSENFCKPNIVYNQDDILKKCINIYIDLYPEYLAYIMKLKRSTNFFEIWKTWKYKIIDALEINEILTQEKDLYIFKNIINNNEYNSLKTDYISRFWSFGAILHNSNPYFYDYYKNKNRKFMSKHKKLKRETEFFLKN